MAELSTWETFLRAHAAVLPLLEADLAQADRVPLSQYDVLANLEEAGGSLRLRDLVSAVVLSQPSVSRLVDVLQRDGLVRRSRPHDDRRGTIVQLTDEGARELQRARLVHARSIQAYFDAHLDPGESDCVRAALGKVLRAAALAQGRATAAGPGTA